jgi:hypothetical protein
MGTPAAVLLLTFRLRTTPVLTRLLSSYSCSAKTLRRHGSESSGSRETALGTRAAVLISMDSAWQS